MEFSKPNAASRPNCSVANLRKERIWSVLEPSKEGDAVSRWFDFAILILILISTLAIVLESVESLQIRYGSIFKTLELILVSVFTAEYLARTWACTADARFRRPVIGRLRHAAQPLMIFDLLAIAPFFLLAVGIDLRFVRVLRSFRVLRLAKLTRYSSAVRLMGKVIRRSWDELAVTVFVISIFIVLASILIHAAEHQAQPKVFSDVPSSMWWAVVTLTTVGYGDAYPITAIGKVIAGFIAILGIGLLALPTAILGSAFVEELSAAKRKRKASSCPHCGKSIDHDH
ncbi:MAG: voltage-gated potassium channel [Verrucomicrobiales bacterium]